MGKNRIITEVRRTAGASAWRVVSGPSIDTPHSHDWPILSLFVMGTSRKLSENEDVVISSASAVLHRAGAVHANIVGERGSEQIDIVFDPTWLPSEHRILGEGISNWIGGDVALQARRLVQLWNSASAHEEELRSVTGQFLSAAFHSRTRRTPSWLPTVIEMLTSQPNLKAADLAAASGLRPAWLAQVFRAATGEGLAEMAMRLRVERAVTLLGKTGLQTAQIALESGFCDQSHMNRCFRTVLGRTPQQVRYEQRQLNQML